MSNIDDISKQIEGIENSLKAFQDKAKLELENNGKIATETRQAIDKMTEKQLDIATRLLAIEKQGGAPGGGQPANKSWGEQFVNSASYKAFQSKESQRAGFTVQNNIVTTQSPTTLIQEDRKPGIIPGPEQVLTLESFLNSVPTTSNAVQFVREASFVNNAAAVAEAAAKPESDITFNILTMPIATVAHYINLTEQLAADAPTVQAYIENRMIYGVNRNVETQLAVGNGTGANISGLFKAGNFTPHGYTDANLAAVSATLKKYVLIRKVMADLYVSGYPADAIIVNPADWATMELELIVSPNLNIPVRVDQVGLTRLWGVPVIQAIGVAADSFLVGAFRMAATVHTRQDIRVDMSSEHIDNFTKNLITLRVERRLALTVEVPAAIRGGDITPA